MTTFWIWGRRPVLAALRAGTVRSVRLARARDPSAILRQIRTEADQRGVPIELVDVSEIDAIAPHQTTQGVAAEVRHRSVSGIDVLLAEGEAVTAFLLVIDQIQDPHNLGALFRAANAVGVQGVVLSDRHTAPLSGVVAKASAGSLSSTPHTRVSNLVTAIDRLRRAGVWVMGLDDSSEASIYDADLTVPLALVVGSEATGLRRLTCEHCDVLLRVPMYGAVESLNAAMAAAIAMYEAVRQRLAAGESPARRIQ
jgi:23S rRNA (guanosine2251-2'-O)-methyltransferase